jgi:hypothetical protein
MESCGVAVDDGSLDDLPEHPMRETMTKVSKASRVIIETISAVAEQVFDRRSAVENSLGLTVRHGLVNRDASGSSTS